jgi:hypothetical protein
MIADKLIDSGRPSPEREHPDAEAGAHVERSGFHSEEEHPRTAYDVEEAHRQLVDWTEDELKQVPLLPVRARLDQGATYVDLRDPARREFTATGEMQVPPDGLYIPKSGVDHRTWVRLLGLRTAERIGQA